MANDLFAELVQSVFDLKDRLAHEHERNSYEKFSEPQKYYRFRINTAILRDLRTLKHEQLMSMGLFNYPHPKIFDFNYIEDHTVYPWVLEEIPSGEDRVK